MWLLTNAATGTKLYVLGTLHSSRVLENLVHGVGLLEFLHRTSFDHVYAELEEHAKDVARIDADALIKQLRTAQGPATGRAQQILKGKALAELPSKGLDSVYVAVAS